MWTGGWFAGAEAYGHNIRLFFPNIPAQDLELDTKESDGWTGAGVQTGAEPPGSLPFPAMPLSQVWCLSLKSHL